MNIFNTDEMYWLNKDESTILMIDMTEEQLSKAYITVQKNQARAISTLELNYKLEQGILAAAKKNKFKLKSVDNGNANPYAVRSYQQAKELIKKLARAFKTIHNGKRKENLLQETN